MAKTPDVIDKINNAIRAGTTLTLSVTDLAELAAFVNKQVETSCEHAAMLNLYVERQQGQCSYRVH